MNRTLVSVLALVVLLGLTGAMWALADGRISTTGLATMAALKIIVVGAVFLELDRAWPGWAVVSALVVGIVLGGAVLLMG